MTKNKNDNEDLPDEKDTTKEINKDSEEDNKIIYDIYQDEISLKVHRQMRDYIETRRALEIRLNKSFAKDFVDKEEDEAEKADCDE